MSITDNMRTWMTYCDGDGKHDTGVVSLKVETIAAEADRIDAEHKKLEDFCHCLEEAARKHADVTLFDVDYKPIIHLSGNRRINSKVDEFQQLIINFERELHEHNVGDNS